MQQRKYATGNGRPSGTDGSDFSYRMVVDSRYTKVAKGKSRLSKLIVVQAFIELIGVLTIVLSILKEEIIDRLAVSSVIFGFVSLLIGESGRRRSRINLLKCYMFASSIARLLSIACVLGSKFSLEVIQDMSAWEAKKFELFWSASVILGLLIQIYAIKTTTSLIHNMSPPKRAS